MKSSHMISGKHFMTQNWKGNTIGYVGTPPAPLSSISYSKSSEKLRLVLNTSAHQKHRKRRLLTHLNPSTFASEGGQKHQVRQTLISRSQNESLNLRTINLDGQFAFDIYLKMSVSCLHTICNSTDFHREIHGFWLFNFMS